MLRSLKIFLFLASFSFLAACGGDDGGGADCSDMAAQDRGQAVIQNTCQNCHASTVTGAARNNAPTNITFDNDDNIDQQELRIRARALDEAGGPMPPAANNGPLSDAQKADLEAFLDCR